MSLRRFEPGDAAAVHRWFNNAEATKTLMEQLSVGGILVVPVGGDANEQEVVRIRRTEAGFEQEPLLPVRFVPLVPGVAEG